jgi:hypothetical protein
VSFHQVGVASTHCISAHFIAHSNERLSPRALTLAKHAKANAARAEAEAARPGEGQLYSALPLVFSPINHGRSGGGGGTRRRKRARHGRKQLRLRPRPQPPGQFYQGNEESSLLPEGTELSAELGAAPRVAFLPASHFAVP